jgi:hypothetical protein
VALRLMSETRKPAVQSLFETGMLVLFRIVDIHTELSPDKENVFVRADLYCRGCISNALYGGS